MGLRRRCDDSAGLDKSMATEDKCCTIVPYFKIHSGKLDAFKQICERFVEKTRSEPKCLYYGFSFSGDQVHCREGYEDAAGLIAHVENIGAVLEEALKISDITRFEFHGPAGELAKVRERLGHLNAEYFTLEYGFRRDAP